MIDEERFKKSLLDAMRHENEKPYVERTEYDRGYYNGLAEALQIVCNQIMDEVFEERRHHYLNCDISDCRRCG